MTDEIIEVECSVSLPSLVLVQRIYGTNSVENDLEARAKELLALNKVPHPAFMPKIVKASIRGMMPEVRSTRRI